LDNHPPVQSGLILHLRNLPLKHQSPEGRFRRRIVDDLKRNALPVRLARRDNLRVNPNLPARLTVWLAFYALPTLSPDAEFSH
jgi:hypothetical protein